MTQDQQTNFLVSYIVDKMTTYLMNDYGLDLSTSLNIIYTSEIFQHLLDKESFLLSQSPAYNYELLKKEYEHGYLFN